MMTQEKIMTTKEIANRLVELCRDAQYEQAQKELYAENAVSIEPDSVQGWEPRTKGLNNIIKKGEQWQEMIEQFHGVFVSDPIIAGNHIALSLGMDITMKGKPRNKMEELCVYEVKDGKVVSEQFFY
jgi:hypothetical protein